MPQNQRGSFKLYPRVNKNYETSKFHKSFGFLCSALIIFTKLVLERTEKLCYYPRLKAMLYCNLPMQL